MEYDHWRQHDVDQNVIDWDDDGCVDTKSFNGQDFAECICHESATGSARSDGDSLSSLSEGVSHSLSNATSELLNLLTLSPSINDDKNVITSDTQNNKYDKVMDRDEEADSEDVLVDKLSNWERKQNHQDREAGQKERLQVDQQIDEHKGN